MMLTAKEVRVQRSKPVRAWHLLLSAMTLDPHPPPSPFLVSGTHYNIYPFK
jgi:hypothetical protein